MLLIKDRYKAKELLQQKINEAEEIWDTNPLDLQNAKIAANDWYQEVINLLYDIYDDPKPLINKMNYILGKDEKPAISVSFRKALNINLIDMDKDTLIFKNKLQKILAVLKKEMQSYTI